MARPLRVLAVNYNRILREGICVLIRMQPDFELVGSAAAAGPAVRLFAEKRPGLTLMDLDLPSDGGLDAIRRIHLIDPAAWIIALIAHECDDRCRHAMAAGASTVLAKDLIGTILVPLIRRTAPRNQVDENADLWA